MQLYIYTSLNCTTVKTAMYTSLDNVHYLMGVIIIITLHTKRFLFRDERSRYVVAAVFRSTAHKLYTRVYIWCALDQICLVSYTTDTTDQYKHTHTDFTINVWPIYKYDTWSAKHYGIWPFYTAMPCQGLTHVYDSDTFCAHRSLCSLLILIAVCHPIWSGRHMKTSVQ